jgi:hypothetical protein
MTGGAGGNPSMQAAIVSLQKKLATMNGVPVLQVMHMKTGGGAAAQAQSDPRMAQGMAQARARLEEMAKQGGPQGDMAKQQLARMGGAMGGSPGGMEITLEYGSFSASSIPDSVFAIPSGYQQTAK